MSGASHSLTLARPLRIRQLDNRHWAIDGTPTDCITLALNKILSDDQRPHICVSGINHGGNLGDDATYSGTVAGALEASILGVPGIALSLVARDNFEFEESAAFAVVAARKVLEEGLPEGTLIDVNGQTLRITYTGGDGNDVVLIADGPPTMTAIANRTLDEDQTLGPIAFTVGDWPNSIWYLRKWSTALKNTFDGLIYAALTGVSFAWLWPG